MTWGFNVYAYGRLQRVSGFDTEARCDRIRERLTVQQPGWVVAERCSIDTDGPSGLG